MKRRFFLISLILFVLGGAYSCTEPDSLQDTDYNEWMSGGSETVLNQGAGAFGEMFPNLSPSKARIHEIGDMAFEATFVSAPAKINPGLGPVFNNVSCASCHVSDGRGRPPFTGEQNSSMLLRLSIPGTDEHGGPKPVPGFGGQLQHRGIFGAVPEATVDIGYTEKEYAFADGEKYQLRFPTYTLKNPYTALPADVMISPRVAPPAFGLGLLEHIDDQDILAGADEDDANDDGISGRRNYVWDIPTQKKVLGRFGWKANNSSLLQQTASAYNEDMGITNYIFPEESSKNQPQDDHLDDGLLEVSDSIVQAVAFYVETLGVPARRKANDPEVLAGKKVFMEAGCGACHTPRFITKTDVAFPEMSGQVIFPYTDLLLHDMGPDLADNRPDFEATGSEWRTVPLWGIGLTQVVNGHQNFLHDGRARTLMEAVMWHGGEAEKSKDYIKDQPKSSRDALVKFLESL